MITEFLATFWGMLCEMAPYLLLGFGFAGVLHAFLPSSFYRRHLGRPGFGSVVKAALFGVPLPLCSCGVIPTAMALRKEGATKGATVSFLIATPQTGVDSIAATYSMMGLPFAIVRPVAALITALFGGVLASTKADSAASAASVESMTEPDGDMRGEGFFQRCLTALRYGFGTMLQDLGRWLLIGLLLAALITMAVPDDFFARYVNSPLLGMLLVLLLAVPMYLCATGSIPIAMALVLKGLSPGAALVMLMAGPATNVASILLVYKVLGRRTTATYVGSIILGAVAFGLAIDYLLPASWFAISAPVGVGDACCQAHATGIPYFETICGVVISVLLALGLFKRHHHHHDHCCHDHCNCNHNHSENNQNPTTTVMNKYSISGMMCNHCRANVEKTIAALPGVTSVTVDLPSATAIVEGTAAPADVIAAVESLGYTAAMA
ncbi:MAG: SO_0444 family Cu/Zn efflux transporter [Muribaculaceae bacterium]|nr:SO_0444 family Cu/Zn efflux transporter [Muribaculaceae bacterium]